MRDTSFPSDPLQQFIDAVGIALDSHSVESRFLPEIGEAMRRLIADDHWLADTYAQPHEKYYQQYLLHLDPANRFSVVSFVWGPGQATPIHDHLVWGVIGVLRGAEISDPYSAGSAGHAPVRGSPQRLNVGDVGYVSPSIGDVHRVRNAFDDQVSISIHVYGGDIGAISRHVYDHDNAARKPFVSGYANKAEGTPRM